MKDFWSEKNQKAGSLEIVYKYFGFVLFEHS